MHDCAGNTKPRKKMANSCVRLLSRAVAEEPDSQGACHVVYSLHRVRAREVVRKRKGVVRKGKGF